jgi:hypothetical protein
MNPKITLPRSTQLSPEGLAIDKSKVYALFSQNTKHGHET